MSAAPYYGADIAWEALEERLAGLSTLAPHERVSVLESMVWTGELPVAAYSALPILASQPVLRAGSPVAYAPLPRLDQGLYDHPWEDYGYAPAEYLARLPRSNMPRNRPKLYAMGLPPRSLPSWLRQRDAGFRAAAVCLLDLAGKPILHGESLSPYRLLRFSVLALTPASVGQDFLRRWGGGPQQDWTHFFMETQDALESDLLDVLATGIREL